MGIGVMMVGQEDEWAQRVTRGLGGGTPQWSWWGRGGTVGVQGSWWLNGGGHIGDIEVMVVGQGGGGGGAVGI